MNVGQHPRFLKFAILILFLTGCSSVHSKNDTDDESPQALKRQILELQKSQTAQAAKIEELNNKILMLKDQVQAPPQVVGPVAQSQGMQSPSVQSPHPVQDPNPKADVGLPPQEEATREATIPPPVEMKVDPLSPVAAPSPKKVVTKPKFLTPVEKLYRQVVINSKKQKLDEAGREVNLMLKQYRSSPLTNNALYLYAETLYERENYVKSAEEFEKLYKLFPDGNKAVAALYKLGMSYQKMGHPSEAQETFQNIVSVYPGSREALDAENQILGSQGDKKESQ